MADYTKYTHVRRYGTEGTEGYLNGHVVATPKIDGANCTCWFDSEDNTARIGGRNTPVTEPSDLSWLGAWFEDRAKGNAEASELARFVEEHPTLIVYGEWMGGYKKPKFQGAIKDYDKEHLNTIKIFDVFDTKRDDFVGDHEWRDMFAEGYPELSKNAVPILGEFDNPTEDDIWALAENNFYMRENAGIPGEGIVVRNRDFRDEYGNYHIVKFVRTDWRKNANKQQREAIEEDIEQAIVDEYMTDAEMSKTANKAATRFGDDEFNAADKRHMGFFMSVIFKDLLEENIMDIMKRYKKPVIDFGRLSGMASKRGQEWLSENGYVTR